MLTPGCWSVPSSAALLVSALEMVGRPLLLQLQLLLLLLLCGSRAAALKLPGYTTHTGVDITGA